MQASVTQLELDPSILGTPDRCHKLTMSKPALLSTLFFSFMEGSFVLLLIQYQVPGPDLATGFYTLSPTPAHSLFY